jgi:hypothetical protein
MAEANKFMTYFNTYPRDVTNPGPDQNPGIAEAIVTPIPEEQKYRKVPLEEQEDQGPDQKPDQ